MASKTARASMRAGASTEKQVVIPDEKLVQLYRDDREAHIWPGLQASDAVLRTLDAADARISELGISLENAVRDLAESQRQLTLVNSIIATLKQAQADISRDDTRDAARAAAGDAAKGHQVVAGISESETA